MGFFSRFRKKVNIDYEFKLNNIDSYSLMIDIDTPIGWWYQVIEVVNKLRGTDIEVLDEFRIDERFKGKAVKRVYPIVKNIEKEIKKDFHQFSIVTVNCDDMVFKKVSKDKVHAKISLSGVCHAIKK